MQAKQPSTRRAVHRKWLLIPLLGLVVLAANRTPLEAPLRTFLEYIQGIGAWGVLSVGLLFILACVLLIPGSLLTVSAGFLAAAHWQSQPVLAIVIGVCVVSLGSTTGATLAFLLGRNVARDWVGRRIAKYPQFQALDQAIGRDGFKMTLLIRLSPLLPFNLLNYALGLSALRLRDYILGSWLGMLAPTTLYVYIGATAQELAQLWARDSAQSPLEYGMLALGLLATFAVVYLLTRQARRQYRQRIAAPPAVCDPPPSDGLEK